MTDVILYAPNGFRIQPGNLQLPTGLIALSSVLKKGGFSVKIINEMTLNDSIKHAMKVIDSKTILFGITSMSGTPIYDALIVSKKVKEKYPDLPIVWGGSHASLLPEQTVKHPLVDIIVRGPGEKTIVALTKALKNKKPLKDIKGITYKENGKIVNNPDADYVDINEFPMLDYGALDMEKYIAATPKSKMTYDSLNTRIMSYHSSRGCCHRCGFCAIHAFCRGVWQRYTPERVIKELKILVKKYKVNGIFFMDDNFFVDKNRVEKICDLLIKENLNIIWAGNCRIDYFVGYSDEFVDKLKRSGLVQLVFGAESGSQRMLDYMKKDITVEQILESAKKCKKHGIKTKYCFMVGLPTERTDDLYKTVDVVNKIYQIFPQSIGSISIYTPYEGTELMEQSIKYGLKPPTDLEGWGKYNYLSFNTPWGTKEFVNLVKIISMTSHFLVGYQSSERFDSMWKKVSFILLKKDAKFRWEHKMFKFAPEWKLVKRYFDAQIQKYENQWMKTLEAI
jgi:radical SAM superfamily enzyme YgiQ (UPF0313 family)